VIHDEKHQLRALDALASFRKQSDANEQGFPHLPFQTETVKEVRAYAESVRGSYDTVCLIGIGGSALGAWALDCGIRGPHPVQGAFSSTHPRRVILDNVDTAFTVNWGVATGLRGVIPFHETFWPLDG